MGPWKTSKPNQKAEAKSEDPIADAGAEPDSVEVHDQDGGSPGTNYEENKTNISICVPQAAAGVSLCSVRGLGSCTELIAQAKSRKTWYGGTWPRTPKASPVTQVAKESIAAASTEASETTSSTQKRVSPYRKNPLQDHSLYLSKDISNSSRSLPLAAMTTSANIASNSSGTTATEHGRTGGEPANGNARDDDASGGRSGRATNSYSDIECRDGAMESNLKSSSAAILDAQDKLGGWENSEMSSGWIGWFTRSTGRSHQTPNARLQPSREDQHSDGITSPNTASKCDSKAPNTHLNGRRNPGPGTGVMARESASRSWLGLWGNSLTSPQSKDLEPIANGLNSDGTKPVEVSRLASKDKAQVERISAPSSQTSDQSAKASKSYGWAFWTTDRVRSDDTGTAGKASVGTSAFASPDLQSRSATKDLDRTKASTPIETRQHVELSTETPTEAFEGTKEGKKLTKVEALAPPAKTEKNEVALVKPKQHRINLLLPSLDLTYRTIPKTGILLQLGRFLQSTKTSNDTKHINLQSPPRIKRAIAIVIMLDIP